MCPICSEDEAKRFPHRAHKSVSLTALGDLADEAAVTTFYGGVPKLVGLDPHRGRLRVRADREERQGAADGADRDQSGLGLSVLPRGGAARSASGGGGRIVNVAARPALEPRSGASMTAYTARKAGVAALTDRARRGGREGRHSGERGRALDHGHAGQPQGDAEGGLRDAGRRSRRSRRRSCSWRRRRTR